MSAELEPYLRRLDRLGLTGVSQKFENFRKELIDQGELPDPLPVPLIGSKRLEFIQERAAGLAELGKVDENTDPKVIKKVERLCDSLIYPTSRALKRFGVGQFIKDYKDYYDPKKREFLQETHMSLALTFEETDPKLLPKAINKPDFSAFQQSLPGPLREVARVRLAIHFYPDPNLPLPEELDLSNTLINS